MRSCQNWVVLATALIVATACSETPDRAPKPSLVAGSIVDAEPYVCKFVPEQALRVVSGFTEPLVEVMDGNEGDGDCDAPDPAAHLLDVSWLREGRDWTNEKLMGIVKERIDIMTMHRGTSIPSDLGLGMTARVSSDWEPYQIVSKFSCGGDAALIALGIGRIADGRDAVNDRIELMRIAQKRYAELYNCTLGR